MYANFQQGAYPTSYLDATLEKFCDMGIYSQSYFFLKWLFVLPLAPLWAKLLKNIIRKHWNVLSADPVCKTLFSDSNLCLFLSQKNKGLHCTCWHVAVQRSLDGPGFFPCHNCSTCENSKKTSTFSSHVTSRKYNTRQCLTCISARVILIYIPYPCCLLNMNAKLTDLLNLYYWTQKCH